MVIHPSAYQYIYTFGKYRGLSLGHVAELNRSFLDWTIGANGVPMIWKEAAARVLQGLSIEGMALPKALPPDPDKVNMFAVDAVNGTVGVRFPNDKELKDRFKLRVDGHRFNEEEVRWEFPKEHLLVAVDVFGGTKVVHADQWVKNWFVEEQNRRALLDGIREQSDAEIDVPTLLELRPFQKVAIQFGEAAGNRWMDADDMGLGKTPTGIGWALRQGGKTLITCPFAVAAQWVAEIKKFAGKNACLWTADGIVGHKNAQFHVINFDIVAKNLEELQAIKFANLICDEATKLKNHKSQRTKAVMGYWDKAHARRVKGLEIPNVVLLTGTPVLNNQKEYFTLLSFLDRKRFNRPDVFVRRYGGKAAEAQNLSELHDRAKQLVIRRLKKDVAKEIPAKSRNNYVISMDKRERKAYYDHMKALFKKWRMVGKPSAAQMSEVRNFIFEMKMPRTIDFLDEMLEAERKVIVFAIQQEHVERIAKHYGVRARYIHGGVTGKAREAAKQDFISGKANILVMTILTGGMGMDGLQQVCSDTLFVDRWWTPGDHDQAEDRTNRMGQTEPTTQNYLTVEDTYDEDMAALHIEKQAVIDQAVNGVISMAESAINEIRTTSIFSALVKKMAQRMEEDAATFEEPDEVVESVAA